MFNIRVKKTKNKNKTKLCQMTDRVRIPQCSLCLGFTPYLYTCSVNSPGFEVLRPGSQCTEKGADGRCDYSHNVFRKS